MKVESEYRIGNFFSDRIEGSFDAGLIYVILSSFVSGPEKRKLTMKQKTEALLKMMNDGFSNCKSEYLSKFPSGNDKEFQEYLNERGDIIIKGVESIIK